MLGELQFLKSLADMGIAHHMALLTRVVGFVE